MRLEQKFTTSFWRSFQTLPPVTYVRSFLAYMTKIINIVVVNVCRIIKYFIFSKMSLNRSGETTVELATQSRKLFVFLHLFKVLGNFTCLLEDLRHWYKYITKMIRLIAASGLCNPQSVRHWFKCNLYAKLSGKWNEVPKWSGQLAS